MIEGRLYRADTAACLLPKVWRTHGVVDRLRGLLGRAPLGRDEGLLIAPCAAVHTCFMRYALDLAFLDRNWLIRKIVARLQPWRMAACSGAEMVLELPAGAVAELRLEPGLRLRWEAYP